MISKREETKRGGQKTLLNKHKTKPREIGNCKLGGIDSGPLKLENIDSGWRKLLQGREFI